MSNALNVTYDLHADIDGCTIIRNIKGGICGPFDSAEVGDESMTIGTAEEWAKTKGYRRTSQWRFIATGGLVCELAKTGI